MCSIVDFVRMWWIVKKKHFENYLKNRIYSKFKAAKDLLLAEKKKKLPVEGS